MFSFQKYIFAVLLLISIQMPVFSADAEDQSVIVLYGDSISQGYNAAFAQQYQGNDLLFGFGQTNYGQPDIQLSSILNNSGRTSLVANYGAGGTPSGPSQNPNLVAVLHGINRIDSATSRIKSIYPGKNYYLLLMYGTNDYGWGIGPSTTGFNIGVIIDRIKAAGFVPVVATIPPRSDGVIVTTRNSFIAAKVSEKNLASSPVYFADHYSKLAPTWDLLRDDELHPNDAGYLVIAQNWFDSVLEAIIEKDSLLFPIAPIIDLLLNE